MNNVSKSIMWAGIVLILTTGIIHFIDAPDTFGEATYKGVLFTLNGVGAIGAAYGIFRGAAWGWLLGLLIAGGAIIGYIISRTTGLLGLEVDPNWFEPIGVLSLIVECLFALIAVYSLAAADNK